MNKPILTIGIPTYNHAQALNECLAALTAQFSDADVFDFVEVFISDNGDGGNLQKVVDEYHLDDGQTDNTQEIVEKYQKKFSNIRYSRNGKNIGFDRNVDAVLSNARGQFCWTLSSSECLESGSISFVLSMIDQHKDCAYFCVSNQREDKNHTTIRRFANGNEWLKEMGLFGGQISQCIFNTQFLPTNRARYYDNVWFHLSVFWEIISHRPVILLPCLFKIPDYDAPCRWAKGGWGFRTYIYLKRIVADLPQYGYDRDIVDGLLVGLAKGFPSTVAAAKINELPVTWDRFVLMVKEFRTYPIYLMFAIGVFLTPSILLRLVKRLK